VSVDADRDDRDLEAEPTNSAAGQGSVPVDAVCVGCGRTRVIRARIRAMEVDPQTDSTALEATDCASFTSICRSCRAVTWWNPIAVLTGLLESERERERGE
jgi:hypothetical protein